MIPRTLEEWNIGKIKALLTKGYYETDYFDFKEKLPASKDARGKERLSKTCCAFANNAGGFLVFGIKDKGSIEDRLVGIDTKIDFPEHFGNFPKKCSPIVHWEFKNPAIELENGKVIHVVHIPKSWDAPHCFGDRDSGWYFTKRTNKGDEGMSPEEIRNSYLNFYEKKLKVELMYVNLSQIKNNALDHMSIENDNMDKLIMLNTFEISSLQLMVSETLVLLSQKPEIIFKINAIIKECNQVNNKFSMISGAFHLPMTNKESILRSHNEYVQGLCEKIVSNVDQALELIDKLLDS